MVNNVAHCGGAPPTLFTRIAEPGRLMVLLTATSVSCESAIFSGAPMEKIPCVAYPYTRRAPWGKEEGETREGEKRGEGEGGGGKV